MVIDPDVACARYAIPDACRSDPAGHLREAVPRRRADGRGADGAGRGVAAGGLEASRGAQAGRAGARPPRGSPDALPGAPPRAGAAARLDQPDGRLLGEPVRPPRGSAQEDGPMKKATTKPKSGAKDQKGESPARLIDGRIKELGDWRGETLARVRALIKQADPDVTEEWKWRGVPVWEHAGIICTGETYKAVVKLTFAKGASLDDPSGLFNSSLEGNTRRAIDLHEGDKIDEAALKALIRAAVALNTKAKSKA